MRRGALKRGGINATCAPAVILLDRVWPARRKGVTTVVTTVAARAVRLRRDTGMPSLAASHATAQCSLTRSCVSGCGNTGQDNQLGATPPFPRAARYSAFCCPQCTKKVANHASYTHPRKQVVQDRNHHRNRGRIRRHLAFDMSAGTRLKLIRTMWGLWRMADGPRAFEEVIPVLADLGCVRGRATRGLFCVHTLSSRRL